MTQLGSTHQGPLSRALTEYQDSRRCNRDELGQEIGVDGDTVSAFIREIRDPTLPTLKKIAQALHWTAFEVGVVAIYEPSAVRKLREKKQRKKEGKKREPKKKQQLAAQTGDGVPG